MIRKEKFTPDQPEAHNPQVESVRAALETMYEIGASYVELLSADEAIALGDELESEALSNTDPRSPGALDTSGRLRYSGDSPMKIGLEQSIAELVHQASDGAINYGHDSRASTQVFVTPSEESTDLDWHIDEVAEDAVAILTLKNSADFYYLSDKDKKIHAFTAKPGTLAFVRGNTRDSGPIWHKATKPKEPGSRVAISLANNNYASVVNLHEGARARKAYAEYLDKVGNKLEKKRLRFGGKRVIWDDKET